MAYQTMMVFLNDAEQAKQLIKAAINIANRHHAHLIGVYVKPPLQIYANGDAAVYLMNDHQEYHEKLSRQLEELFLSMTSNEDFVTEWRYISRALTSTPDAVAEISRTADLLIVGQKNIGAQDPDIWKSTEQLLMTAGRPVLIIPRQHDFEAIGSQVFVAWDGGASSTRATFDSLSALQLADSVTLHRINTTQDDRHRIVGVPGEMGKSLNRHGIKVELVESDAYTSDIGAELLTYAREKGADLLVMGAYGHSRFREYIFGGVTRHVLDNMTLPVLMSH